MVSSHVSLLTNVRCSIVQFARAWTAYAIVECVFVSIVPWLVTPQYAYNPLHWGFTATLFLLYPAIGVALGVLCALAVAALAPRHSVLPTSRPRFHAAAGSFSLVVACAANLLLFARHIDLSEVPALSLSLLLIVALGLSAFSSRWSDRLSFLTHPLTVSLLLLGPPFVTGQLSASRVAAKAAANLAYVAVICGISFSLHQANAALRLWRRDTPAGETARRPLALLALLACAVLGCSFFVDQAVLRDAAPSNASAATRTANVILITMDTVRADHLSLYGYERDTTPNLRALAEHATLYTNAIASSDMTLATHASIFTGLYSRQHGAHYEIPKHPWGRALAGSFTTLAEVLSANGYATMGVVSNYGYLGREYGFQQGFQYYDQRVAVPFLAQTAPFFLRHSIRNFLVRFDSRREFERTRRRAEEINRELFTLLSNASRNQRPFFLFANYMDAHWPYLPPPPFDTVYPGKNEPLPWERWYPILRDVMNLKRTLTEHEYDHMVSQYDGGVAYLDMHLGNLIAVLKTMGLYDNCMIIITSDHGEVFGRRNLVGHGVSVYQDQVHVPLLIKYPNDDQPRVVDQVVSVVDLMPTVLDVLGIQVSADLPGQSLARSEAIRSRPVFSETFPDGFLSKLHPRFERVERAVFTWPHKFIGSTAGRKELYSLAVDPTEEHDISDGQADVSKEIETTLVQWLESTPQFRQPRTNGDVSEAQKERLRALGYMQ